jgi:hypothetical protein
MASQGLRREKQIRRQLVKDLADTRGSGSVSNHGVSKARPNPKPKPADFGLLHWTGSAAWFGNE